MVEKEEEDSMLVAVAAIGSSIEYVFSISIESVLYFCRMCSL
jgi:hypothetical protein